MSNDVDNSPDKKLPQISSDTIQEKFTEKMRQIELKERERVTEAKAAQLGLQYIDLSKVPISPDTLTLIDMETSKRLKVVSFLYTGTGGELRLGAVDPTLPEVQELLEKLAKSHYANGVLYLISPHSFEVAYHLYAKIPRVRKVLKGVKITEEDLKKYQNELKSFKELDKKIQTVSITEMVTLVIAAAIQARASDIHIEAEEGGINIRFRIDGVLHDVASLAPKLWHQIISRIKLLSGLKLNIEDRPQDGRFTIHLTNEKIDVRVSTVPTAFGESVVMRLLMSSAVGLMFEDLGLRGKAYSDLEREIKKPNGMIITTGPTGSGKTTTLYAILNKLNNEETKIITLEDPIEYKLPGINQSQIDHSKDYTFAKGLRSLLRQDPDIVMVGEIRDLETADTAINAALTGHLVISTIHTNSASGAIPRFLAMGVKPFLLAPALNSIIGQRLVRKICNECKEEVELDSATMSKVIKALSEISEASGARLKSLDNLKFYKGKGCTVCNNLGYKGRIGIFEIMIMNKEIEDVILSGKVSEYVLQDIAIKNGMVTMLQDGLLKAVDGITSVDEVFRVTK